MSARWSSADLAKNPASVAQAARKPPVRHQEPPSPPASPVGKKKPRHLEDDLQAACVQWFRAQYGCLACLLFAIPNGGQRNAREGARLKRQGVTAGVPDLLLAVSGTGGVPGLFIELKVGRNRPSAAQEAHMKLLQLEGFGTAVVYSLEAFQQVVTAHLARPKFAVLAAVETFCAPSTP